MLAGAKLSIALACVSGAAALNINKVVKSTEETTVYDKSWWSKFWRQAPVAPVCPLGAAPTVGRTWNICEGPQFQAPTLAQMQANVQSAEQVKCTKDMSFESLCCMDYQNLQGYLTTTAVAMLNAAQVATPGVNGGPATVLMQDDAFQQPTAPVITVCTLDNPTPVSGASASSTQVKCFTKEFTSGEITGWTAATGHPILNERVEFLKLQGLEAKDIALCKEKVPTCPCSAKVPASAGQSYVAARNEALTTAGMPTITAVGGSGPTQVLVQASTDEKEKTSKFGFGGVMTSGSFMMLSSGF